MQRKYLAAADGFINLGQTNLTGAACKPCPAACSCLRRYEFRLVQLAYQPTDNDGVRIYTSSNAFRFEVPIADIRKHRQNMHRHRKLTIRRHICNNYSYTY